MRAWRYISHPLAPLVAYSAFLTICWIAYAWSGLAPSPVIEHVLAYIWAFLTLYWIVADAGSQGRIPCFDFGFLCFVFYPISFLWYCIWSRGWRGVLTLFLLAGLWVIPVVVATLLGIVLWSAA